MLFIVLNVYFHSLKDSDNAFCHTYFLPSQVQLRIIEARQLSGMQLDPVCTVTIGNQKKHTSVKEQTNTPFWDEFFVFDFKMAAPVLFDKIINFQVFTGRNLVSQGILIGSFKVSSRIVFCELRWKTLAAEKSFQHGKVS